MPHTPPLRHRTVLLLVMLALLLPAMSTSARSRDNSPRQAYMAGEVLIGWEPGTGPAPQAAAHPERMGTDRGDAEWQAAAAAVSRATGLEVLDARPEHGMARLKVAPGNEAAEIARLESLPWVQYAELNHYVAAADAIYPNDPDFSRQWNLHRIKAPDAWTGTRGSFSFVVAVLDTGVTRSHPDLAGQLLTGYNYIDQSYAPEDDSYDSHGTHVTGILAARMNNATGIAGLAPDIRILPMKVLDGAGNGRDDVVAAAIYDATDGQAQVINLSLAGPARSTTMQNAVLYAQQRGVLIVAAAGNCAQDYANCWQQINPDLYPAAYPGVLAVAASDRFDNGTKYSGYKPYIGLAAPGGTETDPVWSTTRTGYGALYGTSMSTPLVSAAAALVWTLKPAASPSDIADILKSTADKVGTDPYSGESYSYASGRNDYFGAGRLNAANAVRWAYPPSISAAPAQVNVLLGGATAAVSRTVDIQNPSAQSVYWQARLLSGSPWLTLTRSAGTSLYGAASTVAFRADRLGLMPGTYIGTIHVESTNSADLSTDIRVQLKVAASLTAAYAPLLGQNIEAGWLDPDAPGALYRNTLPLINDSMVTVGLPFSVRFYGQDLQSLQVSDNGLVAFGPLPGSAARAPTTCPGDGRTPNNAIYVLAYDWNPSLGGRIVVHEPDPKTFVITWQDVRRGGSSAAQSFQLVISSDSVFRGNYRAIESPLPGIIGTENYDATFSQQIICNGAGRQVKSGESVSFETRLPW